MAKIVTAATEAFDEAAAGYDAGFEPYATRLRAVMLATMLRTYRAGDHVLDVNCGTGTDAIALAARGFRVTATDGSPEMIGILKRKLAALPVSQAATVDARALPFSGLEELPAGAFDGALSNFGGLNCAGNLSETLGAVARLLRPGAGFIACLLNRYCLWEFAAHAARLELRGAVRRFAAEGASARIGPNVITVRYYTPRTVAAAMRPWFGIERVFGLSIFSPPPSSTGFISRHPRLVRGLAGVDDALQAAFPFRWLGDHLVVVGRRR